MTARPLSSMTDIRLATVNGQLLPNPQNQALQDFAQWLADTVHHMATTRAPRGSKGVYRFDYRGRSVLAQKKPGYKILIGILPPNEDSVETHPGIAFYFDRKIGQTIISYSELTQFLTRLG